MPLPLLRIEQPTTAAEVAALVRAAATSQTPIFPLGGETALDSGLMPRPQGIGLSLQKLDQLVDYPARDMTVTVGAGMTIEKLQSILAAEHQELPLDIPQAGTATLGGCIAANISGYRRLGGGTLRDYVIGIEAIDGRGAIFHGGGRVVKNVAGYDFCRLLIGSQGTLGVITQVTLKVKPQPPQTAVLLLPINDLEAVDHLIDRVLQAPQLPAGLELFSSLPESLHGQLSLPTVPKAWLAIILQGTESEVNWQLNLLCIELAKHGSAPHVLAPPQRDTLLTHLQDFPALLSNNPANGLALKLSFQPSRLFDGLRWLLNMQSGIAWQAHAGSGIVYALLPKVPTTSLSQWLLHTAHPTVTKLGGRLQLWRVPEGADLTSAALWGPLGDAAELNRAIRAQFDPHGILNTGRFWS
jgi:glycolate oxidase FAD binding subunit